MGSERQRERWLIALSVAAGCVDAAGFVAAGVFPANMTGNSVVLALAVAGVHGDGAWLAGPVLGLFCLGAAAGCRLLRGAQDGWSPCVNRVLALAGGVLLVGAVGMALGLPAPVAPLVTAFAMGLQASAVSQIGVAGVSTIVVTNTLLTVIRRWIGNAPVNAVPPHRSVAMGSWLGYFGGAVLGGLLQRHATPACPMTLSGAVLVALVVATRGLGRGQGN